MTTTPSQAPDEAGVVERNFSDLPDDIQDYVTSAITNSMVYVGSPEHAAALAETVYNALWDKGWLPALSPPPVVEGPTIPDDLRKLSEKATNGEWSVAPYWINSGTPDELTRGMITANNDAPTGIIDENDSNFESLSPDLDFIAAAANFIRQALSNRKDSR